jgi:hypothetical protein
MSPELHETDEYVPPPELCWGEMVLTDSCYGMTGGRRYNCRVCRSYVVTSSPDNHPSHCNARTSEPACGAVEDGHVCDRRAGHDGRHRHRLGPYSAVTWPVAPAPVSPPSGSAGITRATRVSDRVLDGRLSVRTLNALTNASSLRVEGEAPSLGQVFDMDDVALLRTRCIGTRTVREIRALQREVDAPPALETDETTTKDRRWCDSPGDCRYPACACAPYVPAQPAARREGRETHDSGTYGELPAEVRAMIVNHEWDNMTEREQRAWLIGALKTSQWAVHRVLAAPEGVELPADVEQKIKEERWPGELMDGPGEPYETEDVLRLAWQSVAATEPDVALRRWLKTAACYELHIAMLELELSRAQRSGAGDT